MNKGVSKPFQEEAGKNLHSKRKEEKKLTKSNKVNKNIN